MSKNLTLSKTAIEVQVSKIFKKSEKFLVKKCITSSLENVNIYFEKAEKKLFNFFETAYIQYRKNLDDYKGTLGTLKNELAISKKEYTDILDEYTKKDKDEEQPLSKGEKVMYTQRLSILFQNINLTKESIEQYEMQIASTESSVKNIATSHKIAKMSLQNAAIRARDLISQRDRKLDFEKNVDWSSHFNVGNIVAILEEEAKDLEYRRDSKKVLAPETSNKVEESATGTIMNPDEFAKLEE